MHQEHVTDVGMPALGCAQVLWKGFQHVQGGSSKATPVVTAGRFFLGEEQCQFLGCRFCLGSSLGTLLAL